MTVTAHMKLATAQRQLDFLLGHLPRLVDAGRLARAAADTEIRTMRAIVDDCAQRARAVEARYDNKHGAGAWAEHAAAKRSPS